MWAWIRRHKAFTIGGLTFVIGSAVSISALGLYINPATLDYQILLTRPLVLAGGLGIAVLGWLIVLTSVVAHHQTERAPAGEDLPYDPNRAGKPYFLTGPHSYIPPPSVGERARSLFRRWWPPATPPSAAETDVVSKLRPLFGMRFMVAVALALSLVNLGLLIWQMRDNAYRAERPLIYQSAPERNYDPLNLRQMQDDSRYDALRGRIRNLESQQESDRQSLDSLRSRERNRDLFGR